MPDDAPTTTPDDTGPQPVPPLHRAARRGDTAEMARLLGAGGRADDVNARADAAADQGSHYRGLTPLMAVAGEPKGARAETLRWLLARGADPLATSEAGVTAAWYAAGGGIPAWDDDEDEEAGGGGGDPDFAARLRLLLDAGLDPNEGDDNGRTLLVEAASAGDPERVLLLLKRGVSPAPPAAAEPGTPPDAFRIPLFAAAASGSAASVRMLLEAGADPNAVDRDGLPPLAYAATPAVARALLDAGARADAALDPAYSREDVLDAVLERAADAADDVAERALVLAVANTLLDAGAPRERTDANGWTRLYRAAFRHQADAVDLLLERGASAAAGYRGRTPLHAICWQGEYADDATNRQCERIVRALVAAGVPTGARDDDGRTALHEAAGGDWANATAVRTLLELGADPDPVDGSGQTPLHVAATHGAIDSVAALLAAGADPLRLDATGHTPVDLAAAHKRVCDEIVARDATPHPGHADALDQATRAHAALLAAADAARGKARGA